MNNASNFERYEQLGLRFLVALDRGDLDALDSLWAGAESDPELETMFCALSCAFDEDAAETSIEIMIEPGSDSARASHRCLTSGLGVRQLRNGRSIRMRAHRHTGKRRGESRDCR